VPKEKRTLSLSQQIDKFLDVPHAAFEALQACQNINADLLEEMQKLGAYLSTLEDRIADKVMQKLDAATAPVSRPITEEEIPKFKWEPPKPTNGHHVPAVTEEAGARQFLKIAVLGVADRRWQKFVSENPRGYLGHEFVLHNCDGSRIPSVGSADMIIRLPRISHKSTAQIGDAIPVMKWRANANAAPMPVQTPNRAMQWLMRFNKEQKVGAFCLCG